MTTRTRLVIAAVLATALTAVVIAERASEERANRLHRRGDWSSAARIYRARLQEEIPILGGIAADSSATPEDAARGTGPAPAVTPRAPHLHYNLGTTLLELSEAPDARARLSRGAAAPDDQLRALAWYNLGVASLYAAMAAPGSDSALVHVVAAMEENRNALRLSPGREEAAWNLAFARRMLDSLDTGGRRGVQAGEAFSDAELTGDDTRAKGESGDIMAPPGMLGEEETVVDAESEQPLSLAEAAAILNGIRLDGELITRKLLGLASRSLWGTRSRTLGRRW